VAILPAHEVGRRPIVAKYRQDLSVALLLSLMVPSDNQAIAWPCPQG
jgi:hypothetical protein